MTSQKKIDANRCNGRSGRGPRSLSGKSRSRLNALKHGLSVPIIAYPKGKEDALRLARAIAGEGASDALMELAMTIAETELEIQRIGEAKLAAFEQTIRVGDAGDLKPTAPDSHVDANGTTDTFVRALPLLKRLERYERRAYSRRKRAIARLNDLRLLSQVKL